eukprot:5808339-Alexandrium_andersonii.AAC.1
MTPDAGGHCVDLEPEGYGPEPFTPRGFRLYAGGSRDSQLVLYRPFCMDVVLGHGSSAYTRKYALGKQLPPACSWLAASA